MAERAADEETHLLVDREGPRAFKEQRTLNFTGH
jgi:hypothetical protein